MAKFRFKYARSVWVLLSVVLALCLTGLIWNIFNLTQYLWAGAFKIASYSIIIFLTFALSVFVISVMVYGNYVVKKNCLYTCFGFIFYKVKIGDIAQITHFKKSDKLVVYYSDQKFNVIVISPNEYERFVEALRQENKNIVYSNEIELAN